MVRFAGALLVTLLLIPSSAHAQLVAAVLPSARAVQVNTPASAFATIVNASSATAVACDIAPLTAVPARFVYQTTDPLTNAVLGTPNTPVNIPPGGSQSFVVALTPTAAFAETEIQFRFGCAGSPALGVAPTISSVNTLRVLAATSPVADLVIVTATPSQDGALHVRGGIGAFSVAVTNVGGIAPSLLCGPSVEALVATAPARLPLQITSCASDPVTGECPVREPRLDPAVTRTFSVFVAAGGDVVFDPAVNRIEVTYGLRCAGAPTNSLAVFGLSSVAVTTE